MAKLTGHLELGRCPHCSAATPTLAQQHQLTTNDHSNGNVRLWGIYVCRGCGGVVTGWARQQGETVEQVFPAMPSVDETVPDRPRAYLRQALESKHAPAGAVMLAASAVDAMLKLKGYTDGTLYTRIEKATKDHLITADMGQWAHEVRLDANDQRHADQVASLPTVEEASRAIDFATALAELLFVLPARVQRGLKAPHQP